MKPTTSTSSSNSAVLGTTSTQVLLALAARENLIFEKPLDSDSYLGPLQGLAFPEWVKEQVLEQLVLSPGIISIASPPWRELDGLLIDEEILRFVTPPATPKVVFDAFPNEVIAGFTAAEGHSIPENEFASRLSAVTSMVRELEEYKLSHGEEPPNWTQIQIFQVISRVTGREMPYAEAVVQQAKQRAEVFNRAAPIYNAFLEYAQAIDVAKQTNALVHTLNHPASLPSTSSFFTTPETIERPTKIALLRITARKLGKLPYRATLRESLALARDPVTRELRAQLNMWLSELQAGNVSIIEKMERDIAKATTALSRAYIGRRIGTLTTWLGVPTVVAEMILGLPLPYLGISITAVGAAAASYEDEQIKKHGWATFGNT